MKFLSMKRDKKLHKNLKVLELKIGELIYPDRIKKGILFYTESK